MGNEFEIRREGVLSGPPEDVWAAITEGAGAWLWPMEFEPRQGGTAEFGVLTTWDPPHHLVARLDGSDGWFNQVEHVLEARDGGTTWARYVHSGVFVDDWDNQYDGADKHTDFYLHTLGQYLEHYRGRAVTFAQVDGPPAAGAPDALTTAGRALGLRDEVKQGERVRVRLPGVGETDAVVDYRNDYFIGVRTDDAMYRVFGRNHFGHVVGVSVHHFGGENAKPENAKPEDAKPEDASSEALTKAWQAWLDDTYA
jgi:uncharacterized protein YndB with AHSA1/START domain